MEPKWKKLGNNEEYVGAILSLFALKDTRIEKGIRFNELERHLRVVLGLKISKPTLSKYLKNMVNEKLLIKIERNKLDTEYIFNEELINTDIDTFNKIKQEWTEIYNKERSVFLSLSVKEQLIHIIKIIVWRNLSEIRILANPNKGNLKNLELYYLEHPALKYHERLIMAESRENEQYRNEVIKEITSVIEELDSGD